MGKCDCDRWLEIWNLVFMQFDRDASGTLTPLPRPSIDTGMGLERIASVVQNVPSNWETDGFVSILETIASLSGQPYVADERGFPHRVIADHARACTFLVADGVIPSNEGRGYVLRRILRRAVRYSRKLGLAEGSFARVSAAVIDRMAHAYPELERNRDFIMRVISAEETRFGQALATGLNLLDRVVGEVTSAGQRVIPGDEVFRLYDTYGFPAELTQEIAEERGLAVDRTGFDAAMAQQRETARAAMRFGRQRETEAEAYAQLELPGTHFTGYEALRGTSVVVALFADGESVETASAGQAIELFVMETPFYAESGGQVGDQGDVEAPAGRLHIEDTQRVRGDLIVHRGVVDEGTISLGEQVTLSVDAVRRRETARHHTATHLLHAALREVLGPHVQQAGSLVAPDRLRFDFSHLGAVSPEEIARIERLVNERIRDNLLVQTRVMSYPEAVASGALAFFGEKYGDEVRVLAVGPDAVSTRPDEPEQPFSVELCGGTHLRATGEAGSFVIVSEGSVGAGVRRIEAVVGATAERLFDERTQLLGRLAQRIGAQPSDVEQRVQALLTELEAERKRSAHAEHGALRAQVEELAAQAHGVDGTTVLAGQVTVPDMTALRQAGDWLRDRLHQGVVVLGALVNEKPSFVVIVTPDLVGRGLHAGQIANQVAAVTGGKAGGRPEMAQGGGTDASRIGDALANVDELVRTALRPS
jgi:alanyl-tRNA synthetase